VIVSTQVIVGAIGMVGGYALSPQQAEQVQKLIKEVCKDLPYRFPMKK